MWKRIAGWLIWLFGVVLIYLFENNTATRILLFASLFTPVLSIVWAHAAAGQLQYRLFSPKRCEKNGQVCCTLQVHSGLGAIYLYGRLYCRNALTGESVQLPFSLRLKHGKNELFLTLSSAHCGQLELSLDTLQIEDLFGILSKPFVSNTQTVTFSEPDLFLPQIRLVENTTVVLDSEQYSMTHPGSDPSETFSIREYRPGDPIRQIHWKLSQKTGETMLRELGLPIVEQTVLLFDCHSNSDHEHPDVSALDTMAEIFLSLSRALCVQGISHTVGWINRENHRLALLEISEMTEWSEFMHRFFSTVEINGELTLAQSFSAVCPGDVYAHMVIISARASGDLEMLCCGNRVTIFLPDGESVPTGIIPIFYTPGLYKNTLDFVEL